MADEIKKKPAPKKEGKPETAAADNPAAAEKAAAKPAGDGQPAKGANHPAGRPRRPRQRLQRAPPLPLGRKVLRQGPLLRQLRESPPKALQSCRLPSPLPLLPSCSPTISPARKSSRPRARKTSSAA